MEDIVSDCPAARIPDDFPGAMQAIWLVVNVTAYVGGVRARGAQCSQSATLRTGSVAIPDEDALRSKIHEVCGQKVMLDFELAEIYGYTTKNFNRQVKNNIEKFDEDFRFQITAEEWEILRCKKFTSSWGGSRYLPYAFSESGIYMLMTVLRGGLATRQGKALVRLFKQMKGACGEPLHMQLSSEQGAAHAP